MRITDHFSLEEFYFSITAENKKIDNTPKPETVTNIVALVENVLEPVRVKFARPIMVNSGYRCTRLNNAVGGAKNSQHLNGKAADITTGSIETNKELFAMIRSYFKFDQLIWEYGGKWVHVSWNGSSNRGQILSVG